MPQQVFMINDEKLMDDLKEIEKDQFVEIGTGIQDESYQ
jgi:hypothetical protein